MIHVSLQIPSYYDTEYGNDYDDLDFFLDDDFARRSLIGGECSTGCFIWLVLPPKVLSVEHGKIPTKRESEAMLQHYIWNFNSNFISSDRSFSVYPGQLHTQRHFFRFFSILDPKVLVCWLKRPNTCNIFYLEWHIWYWIYLLQCNKYLISNLETQLGIALFLAHLLTPMSSFKSER